MNRWLPIAIVVVLAAVTVFTYLSIRDAGQPEASWYSLKPIPLPPGPDTAKPAPSSAQTPSAPAPETVETGAPPVEVTTKPAPPSPGLEQPPSAPPPTEEGPPPEMPPGQPEPLGLEGRLYPELFVYQALPADAPLAEFPILLVGQNYISWPFYQDMLLIRGLLPAERFAGERFIIPIIPPTPLSPSGEGGDIGGGGKPGYGYGYGYGYNTVR